MPVFLTGSSISPSVPGVYTNVYPPGVGVINGIPTNIGAVVGTGIWGPTNSAVTFGNVTQGAGIFGPVQNRKYDLMTQVSTAALQGANNFRGVRVTDGTDTAATTTALTNCITFNALYTGTFGNNINVAVGPGSLANTWQVVVSAPGVISEVFGNIGQNLTGNALWVAIAAAINSGTNVLRPASRLITAMAGAGTTSPVAAIYSLAGGTDGVAGVTQTTLVGSDTTSPRQGMYALRGTQSAVALLADCDLSTTWATQVAYGISEGTYMILTTPQGDNIANAIATKASNGIDSPWAKMMLGDWVNWLDPANGQRFVSPQGFVMGNLINSAPNLSALNSQLYGISGTQTTAANQYYSQADLGLLIAAGIDVITNPSVGGAYFSCFSGHNTSSNPLEDSDAYTRLTDYVAFTINGGMGQFIGQPNTPTLQATALATLSSYFDTLQEQGLIGNPNDVTARAYSINLSATNNPIQREAVGYLQADITVEYYPIVEKLILNLTAGASIQITRAGTSLSSS